jgi:OOP family OmpA-OmpF porin
MLRSSSSLLKTAVACAAALCVAPAFAQAQQETAWYLGAGIGQSKAKDACNGFGGTGTSCDDKDTAFKLFGGYEFNRNFALELGYNDLGKAKAQFGPNTAEIKSKAWELVGIGSYPFGNGFSAYGKLGFYRAKSDGSTSVGASASETNNDWTVGLGGRYDFTRNMGVRAEWQRYNSVGGGNLGKSDVDVFSIAGIWRF